MIKATCPGRRGQQGVALLITLFALLLMTVIAMGMMVSASTETVINANYKDKQTATFAVMAGLQEARDRIQPATLHIPAPVAMPVLTAANVVYIINPRNGETVAPWLSTNRYKDTELCQEHILGLVSPGAGVPCTASSEFPSVSTWYIAHDNSLSSAAPWNFNPPLDFKWVRITLKSNNMTPVVANGDGSNSNQVCWDGFRQLVMPTGYGPECNRFGRVIHITVNNGGTNYTSPPTVTIGAPGAGGVQATATAVMVPFGTSAVSAVTISNPGLTYTAPPAITFVGGGGSGAAAVATVTPTGAPVSTLTLTAAGTRCYSVAPSVIFSGGGGSGATGTATLAGSNSCVAGLTISGNCSSRKQTTVAGVNLTGGGGGASGLSYTLTFGNGQGPASVQSIEFGGNSYTANPTAPVIFPSGAACPSLVVTPVLGKRVQSLTLIAGGSGYTSSPTVSFTTGTGTTGTQPAASTALGAATTGGQVSSVTLTAGGSGYTSAPTVIFTRDVTDTTGVNATAVASIGATNFTVDSVSVTEEGSLYTTVPTVTFSGGGGTGAAATATLGKGSNWGKIYLITGLAETASGARSMVQMEATTPVTGFSAGAALTLNGPIPVYDPPAFGNSANYVIDGNDSSMTSCGQAPELPRPSVGGYDDPNADPPTTSVAVIGGALPRPDHYTGEGGAPSIKNVYGSLGETMGTIDGLRSLMDSINAVKTNSGNTVSLGTSGSPQINYIDGDLTLNGNSTGYGVLVVTGTLHMGGNFSWFGPIWVVGDGVMDANGGGNGQINGMVFIAKIWDNHAAKNYLGDFGSPVLDWSGGGGNGIRYDHCWATNQMARIPFDAPPSTRPLQILSYRTLPY